MESAYARRHRAMEQERAVAPVPADRAVAALAARVRDTYRVGQDTWDNNSGGVHGLLTERRIANAPRKGLSTAVWILERSLADFRWDVAFWSAQHGGARPASVREALTAMDSAEWSGVNPADGVSGFHPYIHLMAAARVLTAQPRPEAVAPLAGLLEHWLALAERRGEINTRDFFVLHCLVDSYRAAPTTLHPEALIRLVDEDVTCQVTDFDNVPTHVEGGITYVKSVTIDQGTCDLSALARAATER